MYYSKREYDQAVELYEKALLIKRRTLSEEHMSIAMSYNNLGSVYQRL